MRPRAIPFARRGDPISAGPCALRRPRGDRKMALSMTVRRVVTTVDETGKAVLLLDGANPHTKARAHGTVSHLLWVADETPADMRGPADRAAREIGIAPPAGGS